MIVSPSGFVPEGLLRHLRNRKGPSPLPKPEAAGAFTDFVPVCRTVLHTKCTGRIG